MERVSAEAATSKADPMDKVRTMAMIKYVLSQVVLLCYNGVSPPGEGRKVQLRRVDCRETLERGKLFLCLQWVVNSRWGMAIVGVSRGAGVQQAIMARHDAAVNCWCTTAVRQLVR